MILTGELLVMVQVAVGMVVNLYVTVPAHHPGAMPANYFTGSYRSVQWAIAHSPVALAVHAALGLALLVVAIGVAVYAAVSRLRSVTAASVLAALLVIGAGFNGASFLDFGGRATSSLLMALLALGALSCYLIAGYSQRCASSNDDTRRSNGTSVGARAGLGVFMFHILGSGTVSAPGCASRRTLGADHPTGWCHKDVPFLPYD